MTEEEGGKDGGRRLEVAVGLKEEEEGWWEELEGRVGGGARPCSAGDALEVIQWWSPRGESHQPGSRARD